MPRAANRPAPVIFRLSDDELLRIKRILEQYVARDAEQDTGRISACKAMLDQMPMLNGSKREAICSSF